MSGRDLVIGTEVLKAIWQTTKTDITSQSSIHSGKVGRSRLSPGFIVSRCTTSPVLFDIAMPRYHHAIDSTGFQRLADLPPELQSLVLSFLPTRSLFKGLGRTNRYWAGLVDAHTRRRFLANFLEFSPDGTDTRLVFEAQRPIDTVCHKHQLWFSHFGVTNSSPGGAFSTTANFAFQPHESSQPESPVVSQNQRDIAQEAFSRGVSPHFLNRLRQEHHSSSVLPAPHPSSSSIPSNSGTRPRADSAQGFTFVSAPLDHRSQPAGALQRDTAAGRRGQHGGVDDIQQGLDAYDWADPVSSSVTRSRSQSRSRSSSIARQRSHLDKQKPTYKMQLDPLDSFETWILNLTLRRTSPWPLPSTSTNLPRSSLMRSERRVAEGLDRVYRDWFQRPEEDDVVVAADDSRNTGAEMSATEALHLRGITPELLSTFGAVNRMTGSEDSLWNGDTESLPPPRKLEFDNESCQLLIQPHPCSSKFAAYNRHPALLSNYSHAYLSGISMPYSHFNASQRVELVFHVEGVEIHAGRLLAVLESVEEEQLSAMNGVNRNGYTRSLRDVVLVSAGGGASTMRQNGIATWLARQNRGPHPAQYGSEVTLLGAT